jgi:hypothetical protein
VPVAAGHPTGGGEVDMTSVRSVPVVNAAPYWPPDLPETVRSLMRSEQAPQSLAQCGVVAWEQAMRVSWRSSILVSIQ